MNKNLIIVAVIVLLVLMGAGGWWYLKGGHALPMLQTTAGEYVNTEFNISFSHPTDWYCKTAAFTSGHPGWNQTICDNQPDGAYAGDPLVAIKVPADAQPTGGDVREIGHSVLMAKDSSPILVTIYENTTSPDTGSVVYRSAGSNQVPSFAMEGGYGPDKPYASYDVVRATLDPIAQSVAAK